MLRELQRAARFCPAAGCSSPPSVPEFTATLAGAAGVHPRCRAGLPCARVAGLWLRKY